MHGCSGGSMHGCSGGACMVAPAGVCMVALEGHAWLIQGGHAWLLRGACVVAPGGGHAWDMTRYGDMINEQAVHILLECILVFFRFYFFSRNIGKICPKLSAKHTSFLDASQIGTKTHEKSVFENTPETPSFKFI